MNARLANIIQKKLSAQLSMSADEILSLPLPENNELIDVLSNMSVVFDERDSENSDEIYNVDDVEFNLISHCVELNSSAKGCSLNYNNESLACAHVESIFSMEILLQEMSWAA